MLRLVKAINDLGEAGQGKDLLPLLDKFLSNIAKYDEKASHRIAYTVGAALIFLMLDQSVIKSVNLLGVTIENISRLKAFLPPIAMYFALSCTVTQLSRRANEEIAEALLKYEYPDLWRKDVEEYIIPHHLIRALGSLARETKGVSKFVADKGADVLGFATVVAVPVFYIYSSLVLFDELSTSSPLLWTTFLVSTLFFLQSALIIWAFNSISD